MIRCRLQSLHFARPRVRLGSNKSSTMQAAVHEANHRTLHDTALQLKTLQLLEVIRPKHVVKHVDRLHVSIGPHTRRMHTDAVARRTSDGSVAAMMTKAAESNTSLWLVAGSLAWACAGATSVASMVRNDSWKEEKPMETTSLRGMQWRDEDSAAQSDETQEREPPPVMRKRTKTLGSRLAMWALRHLHDEAYEELTSPYEHVSDIHME
ncbi:Aste57867_11294 [Aphanomyces stellatus]|uniref:Aste57867_11294 protein n=1 Tax=Aphanomyces stellatus TaxID=120398 RepID=A0A485KUF5_9STRA|nr:hypothetical protein As57867_011252 [Aphanomyces stellatus]VFT88156.1 Aste57867_11294 [Aphanomyces stellatus]